MLSNSLKTSLISVFIIITGFIAVFVFSNLLEKSRPALSEGYVDEDLALQGAKLKGYSLGMEGLLADWYWMQSLQYIGKKILDNPDKKFSLDDLRPLNPRLLYPYLDNAATLDPHFIAIYEYGANVLPAIDAEQAIKITEKGIANNPDKWRLYHYLGYIYWKTKDYQKAADIYEQGTKIQGAPSWMKMMSAKMRGDGGSRDTSRLIYQQMLEETQDESIQKSIELRLLELDSFDERDAVRPVLTEFQSKNGRCPNNWREILPLLRNVTLPDGKEFHVDKSGNLVDPTGIPYILQEKDGKCDIFVDLGKSKIPS